MSAVVGLEDRLNEVWRWVMDKQVGIIGVYGWGGTGKTTLLRLIQDKLCTKSNEDSIIVIWITVSFDFKVGNVQDEFWRRLGMALDESWVEKSAKEKAKCIYDELSSSKFVLFLDDISQPIDLKGVGVPCPENGSKVILTTRIRDVCEGMAAHKKVRMELLVRKDAWSLFRMKVGEDIFSRDPKIYDLAKHIAKNCKGSPMLLCAVAGAMACRKTYEEWSFGLEELNKVLENGNNVYSVLKFCYDCLPDNKVKSCFLYFSLFPEDFKIPKNDLIDFWISEEFFGYYNSRDSALNVGLDIIDTLTRANLLEEENGCVKMQDMVRDVAQIVAYKSTMFKNAQLLDVRNGEKSGVGRISSMENSVQDIPNITSVLLTFFVQRNPFIMIRNQFMAELTVLDLSYSCMEEVPQGISKLVSLQHLNLSHTWIDRLPVELQELVKLKCLNLENDDQLRVIPGKVISSMSSLQVLRMFRCGFSLEEEEDNVLSAIHMDINELQCLKNLKVLSLTITCRSALENFVSSSTLPSCTQALSLEVFWGSQSLNISHSMSHPKN